MASLAEIRSQYPQYDHVDDETLANALYEKYYSHADRREFDARIGLKPYDNMVELGTKVAQNIGPSLAGSAHTTAVGLAEAAKEIVAPPEVDTSEEVWRSQGYESAAEWIRDGAPGAVAVGGDPIIAPLMAAAGGAAAAAGVSEEIEAKAEEVIQDQARRRAVADLKQMLNAPDVAAGSPEDIAYQTMFAATDIALPMTASLLLRNPAPMVAYGTLRAGPEGYQKARNAGLSPSEARAAGGMYAAAEAVTEFIGTKLLLEGGKTLVGSVIRGAGSEGLTEGATEALNVLIDAGVIGEEMTLAEAGERIKMAGIVGSLLGGPLGGVGHVTKPRDQQAQAEEISEEILGEDPVTVEDSFDFPMPETLLALPPPSEPPSVVRRQPPAPAQQEPTQPSEQELNFQAQEALRKTRQEETAALLATARETIAPLGTFTPAEIENAGRGEPETRTTTNGKLQVQYGRNGQWHDATMDSAGYIHSPGAEADQRRAEQAVQRVMTWRAQTGRAIDAPITVEDMARAKVPQKVIDGVIAARRPNTSGDVVRPADIRTAAEARNIVHDDLNFKELAFRTTGQRNIDRMSQSQLSALKATIDGLPANDKPVTMPIADAPPFTDGQYNKALDALRTQGRYTLKAIKDATGLKTDKDAHAVRDAMVRRGQLVQRAEGDYRLYDIIGQERQAVPDDLPPGAFSEYVTKRVPVNRIQIKVDGKSVGTFGSGSEARERIRDLRKKEAEKGGTPAKIELSQADDTAWGVMENRYDERGNLLGQVVVDTSRDETAARKIAEQRNAAGKQSAPDEATAPQPPRRPVPTALAGRTPEILANLNKIAKQRALPLLGTRVEVTAAIETPLAGHAEGSFVNKLIRIAAGHLEPGLTNDQIVDRLAQVMDHELIHALKSAGVLGPNTEGWKTLVRYARRTKRPNSNETYMQFADRMYKGQPGYTTEADIEEEAIAEAFRAWAANRRNVTGKPASVFRQLVEWFKRLFNSIPDDVFSAIETGQMVRDAITPPGAAMPRAVAAAKMQTARKEIADAAAAKDENLVRVGSRDFLRARAQAREDRYGRSGPKTVLGTTPSKAYSSGSPAPREEVSGLTDRYRQSNPGLPGGLATYLPENVPFLQRVADAQQRAAHQPEALDVAKAYRALTAETRAMFDALGEVTVERWTGEGQPYASSAEMIADIATGRLRMRLSDDMFGTSPDNQGHPMNAASGRAASDGTPLTYNDLFRVVHDVYGRAPNGLTRPDGRDDYNAYHEHARLLSPEARRALATETLAQSAWHHYGPHLRRRDGTVPQPTDVDYLSPDRKEFAEQKAFLLPEELIVADPGWELAAEADTAVEGDQIDVGEKVRYMLAWHGTPHNVDRFSSSKIGTGEGVQAFGHGLYFAGKREVGEFYRRTLARDTNITLNGTVFHSEDAAAASLGLENVQSRYPAQHMLGNMRRGMTEESARAAAIADYPHFDQEAVLAGLDAVKAAQPAVGGSGNLYKVDIPEDNELLDWDAPLSKQPPKVRAILENLGWTKDELGAEDPTGSQIYQRSKPFMGAESAASEALRAAGIPGHRYFDGSSRNAADGTRNYVIYDDSRIQILEANPKFSRFDDNLPGGRLYGNPERSPGGAMSKPEVPSPAFTNERDGNKFFGGELADEQLRRAQTGIDGTTMIYLPPEGFLALADQTPNPEQPVYDALSAEGYKFNTLPSLVLDGYAGIVRAPQSDGAYAARALVGKAEQIPVIIYPKRKENMGLVTALEANGGRIPWPAAGRQENFIEYRGEEPRYSLNAAFGTRVPSTQPDMLNIVDQRVEGWVGKKLHALGRSKRTLPLPKGVRKHLGDSIMDVRIRWIDDRMLSVKEMLEDIRARKGKVDEEADVYAIEQLAGSETVQQVEDRERKLYEPLFAALRQANQGKNPVSPDDLREYLYARHAPERNRYLRSRGAKAPDPSGMSDAKAEAILDKFAIDGKLPVIEDLARMIDAIIADTNRTRVAYGLISQKAVDDSPYRFYVPLRGKAEEELDPASHEEAPRARSGKGYTIGGREDRAATGRRSEAGDIIAHVMLQNTESVIRGEKNKVALSFMRLIKDNPAMGYGTVLESAPTRLVVGANGMIREAGDPKYRQEEDIFTAKWKGKEIIARVHDDRVARAMRADHAGQNGPLTNFFGRMNRYLATVNTSWNLEFMLTNMLRDLQTAGILSAQYDIKGLARNMVTQAPSAMAGIQEVLRKGTTTSRMAQVFKEMQDAGGTTEFLGIHNLDTHVARLRAEAARTGLHPTPRQVVEHLKSVGKFIDDYNKVAENTFRLVAYDTARKAGASVQQAAFLAKNLTINFNKGAENKALMNAYYLFYNASVGGTFTLLRGLKSKRVQKIVAGVVVAGIAQDMLNRALSGDEDDNGVKDYDDIPEYILEHNWVFMAPWTEKGYISISMPYGFNAFHNLGRNLSNAFSGSPVHNPGKSAMSIGMVALEAFNPLGGANDIVNFIAPTFADPWVDLWRNKDFAGNQIVPDRPTFGLEVPDSQKYWSNIGDVPREIAEQLNRLGGGNELRSGKLGPIDVDYSPEVLQFWFDYATGAAGKFVTRNIGLGMKLSDGNFDDVKIGDIPFARRVVGSVTNRGNTERYYENAEEIETVAEEIKLAQETGNAQMLQTVLARSRPQIGLMETFEEGGKLLADLRKQIRDLKANDNIPHDRKQQIITDLQAQQDRIMAQLNKLYFGATGTGPR